MTLKCTISNKIIKCIKAQRKLSRSVLIWSSLVNWWPYLNYPQTRGSNPLALSYQTALIFFVRKSVVLTIVISRVSTWVSTVFWFVLVLLNYHFLDKSEVKTQPIQSCLHTFPCTLCRLDMNDTSLMPHGVRPTIKFAPKFLSTPQNSVFDQKHLQL